MKRHLLLLAALGLAAAQAWGQTVIASGQCGAEGDNVTWTLTADCTLTISGTEAMADYVNQSFQPWHEHQGSIKACTIADGVTSVGRAAFMLCPALESVAIGADVAGIGTYAFAQCTSLASVIIPDGVTSIGNYAFDGCTSLASVTLPDGVTSIGDYAFYDCTSLASVIIPDGVTSVGGYAFWNCTALTSLTCRAAMPPAIEYGAFNKVDKTIPVYVPAGSIEAYRAAEYWDEFANYLPIGSTTGIAAPSLGERIMVKDGEVCINIIGIGEVQVYDLQGRPVLRTTATSFALPQGAYIIKVGDEAIPLIP